jgi:P-type E1-E2 ATPase
MEITMIEVDIPGRGRLTLTNLVLDVNGTIAIDGNLIPGVAQRINTLKRLIDVSMITADTHGRAQEIAAQLEISMVKISSGEEGEQKLRYIQKLGSEHTVCIGNGANDALMLDGAAVGICVLGQEGTSATALASSDVVAVDIDVAFDLLLNPLRLLATLRK